MSKRARDPSRTTNEEKHPQLYIISKRYGRSHGPLVMGLNGVMVTPKILRAQQSKHARRTKHS